MNDDIAAILGLGWMNRQRCRFGSLVEVWHDDALSNDAFGHDSFSR